MSRKLTTEGDDLAGTLAEALFSELYRGNMRELLGYALRRCADPDDAADVVAETFLTAWRRLAEVPPGADGRLWLFGTARHVLANHDRSARRRDRLTERLRDELRCHLPAHLAPEAGPFLDALADLPSPTASSSCWSAGRSWRRAKRRGCSVSRRRQRESAYTGRGGDCAPGSASGAHPTPTKPRPELRRHDEHRHLGP